MTKTKKIKKAFHRIQMMWLNPETKNLVGYSRAWQLGLTTQDDAKCGFENPKTHRLIAPVRAVRLGLAS